MKKIYFTSAFVIAAFAFNAKAQSLAFHKGSFIIGVSEGSTAADYGTNDGMHQAHHYIDGERDPLTLEYGISKHWGVGINIGGDIFKVNPTVFYGIDGLASDTKAITSEFTLDANYHFFVTKRTDLSLVGSFGTSSVSLKGDNLDQSYQYIATGGIVRLGLHAKYYFWKRLGVQAMYSIYSANNNSTKDVKGNTFGNNYSTTLKGRALEFGFVFRFGKIN